MRYFWILLILLMVAGGVYLLSPVATRRPQPLEQSPAPQNPPTNPTKPAGVAAPAPSAAAPTPQGSAKVAALPDPSSSSTPSNPAASQVGASPSSSGANITPANPGSQPLTQPATEPITSPNAAAKVAPSAQGASQKAADQASSNASGQTLPSSAAAAPQADASMQAAAGQVPEIIGTFAVAPGTVESKADGTLLIDQRYVLVGDGSEARPFEISWEMLTSVDADFDPRAGKKKIPYRLAMLHDKYVKLGGFVAFPMNMQHPKELMLMLNQWDGCCIGVPPTPYDAIEVSLDSAVEGEDRFTTTGSVTGRFSIKPYVVGDWLVGLYMLESGSLKPRFGGPGGT